MEDQTEQTLKRAPYHVLLDKCEDHVKVDLLPEDAAKLVMRVRGCRFRLHTSLELVTERREEDYSAYNWRTTVALSQAQAKRMLDDAADFNNRKELKGSPIGLVRVVRLGNCIFLGG